ncbi:clathrin light chain-like isoform X2 [Tigriopus californicus]|uniref:clathrin light chain-like isoform X2 n=1 Tax=Tigriopus californicus TaxID=6832 RepID=UPI0027D9EB50|nr:clathrin light chain-like isoform X2 [Tigriopus californicus]
MDTGSKRKLPSGETQSDKLGHTWLCVIIMEDSSSQENSPVGTSPPSVSPAKNREEPEVIKLWKENQATKLEEKDHLEEQAKIELKAQAKKELEDWYQLHAEQLTKLQTSHREASESAEKEFQSTNNEIQPGTEWERVAKMCDFNPKTCRNTKDISRLRSVILQLKQGGNPTTSAPSI